LTITLRPGFLEDKQDASRSLIRLYLEGGHTNCAFETLEQAKSQLWLSYLTNREQLRWAHDDPYTRPLIEQLNHLRDEHHWYYRLAHDQSFRQVQRTSIPPQQAAHEVVVRERKMRTLTEQLYLHSGNDETVQTHAIALEQIQSSLNANTLLIEFYSDNTGVWAFTLDRTTLQVHTLPISSSAIAKMVEQLQANFARALRAGAHTQPAQALAGLARTILNQFFDALIAPLAERVANYERLIIVPYGALHYLPFHLLYDGARHQIETHEIAILPAAGLAVRRSPQRESRALVLAHTWEGRLPNTVVEAKLVCQRLNGALYRDERAERSVFSMSPCQVLHIAAHGQHRIDEPDFSYIQLGDGQVLTDDLLQYDLSYELVTLSACETGRVNVSAGDELIGLGRGFLYAGVGALVASLWRVDDALTVQWMDHFYGDLQTGKSKAAALRDASLAILSEQPGLHPVFWGAFQLIGNADPLSTFATHQRG
jgi:CHAT domain-containing protein